MPWPEPSPISATEMPPGVLKLPWRDLVDFNWHVTLRYLRQMATYWPVAMAKALRDPYPVAVSDEEFCTLMYNTSMAKLLFPTLDDVDRRRFAAQLGSGDTSHFIKADFSAYAQMTLLAGMYAAPTVSLFERGADGWPVIRAIAVRDLVLTPADGDAWALAKLFVLQGAGHHMVNCNHIPLHFPLDTINAVSKSILPVHHPMRSFLEPHLRFSLALNESALYGAMSVLRTPEWGLYSPFATDRASVYKMVRMGYAGIPGNSAYPAWRFSPDPDPIIGDYGVFLRRYYDAMLAFSRDVAAEVAVGDEPLREWADSIAGFLPGFPDGQAIGEPRLLGRVLARIVWSASVAHAADHYDYGCIPIGKIPLRLRVPPPTSANGDLGPKQAAGRWSDAMRQEMARVLFFKEDTVTRLMDVKYKFGSATLQAAGIAFIRGLRDVDAAMPVRRFIPLASIPASIQF